MTPNPDKSSRYQYQPRYIKLWRKRHRLMVPFDAIRYYRSRAEDLSFKNCWSIAMGMSDFKMNHVYDYSEVMAKYEETNKCSLE